MLARFLEAFEVREVDLVGNDGGMGIVRIFVAAHPQSSTVPYLNRWRRLG